MAITASAAPRGLARGLAKNRARPGSTDMNLVFASAPPNEPSAEPPLRAAIRDLHRLDEAVADARTLAAADIPAEAGDRIAATARAGALTGAPRSYVPSLAAQRRKKRR
jgi:hypothetical protein